MALLGRDTKVTGPLPEGTLLLETFQGKEALGTPYRYDLTLLSDDPNLPMDKLLGQSLTVHIQLDTGDTRYFNGIVTYFAKTGMAMKHTRYVVILNPKLSLFDYTRDCRIFFDGDAPTHATDMLAQRGFTDVESSVQGSYRMREYTVQYRETDLNFVQRLLEEEGIYYFFKHEKDKHTLIMADSASAHGPVSGYESILYLPKQRKQAREEEHFWTLSVAGSLYPGKFSVLRGYDYTKPKAKQAQIEQQVSPLAQPGGDFEDYDYPGGLSEQTDAEAEALVRIEGDHVANTLIEVEGNTMGLGVGDLVKLRKPLSIEGEFNPFWDEADFDKEYLITAASYSISINQYETGEVAESDEPFKATYTLLDSQSHFRPSRTAQKPRIEGPQTALVVGPAGDEIYTDKYGRIKVQFDWDRLGNRDEKSSIWLRVAQVWAGKQWGAIHIPRIGQEVIVEFLEGDPDRPIVTGRVYNTDSMPPYALPDNKTQSGIKSRSSKGGAADNFNEIRFEDLKGKEEFHIQAEKDMSTLVKNNQSTSVGADRSVSVGGNHSVSVTGNQSTTVTKNETQTYNANREMKVKGTNSDEITGAHTGTYKAGRTETVESDGDTLTVSPDKTVTVHGKYDNTVDTEFKVTKAGTSMTITDDFVMSASGKMALSNPGTSVKGEGTKLSLSGNSEVSLTCGSASITLKSDGTIEITGTTVKVGNASNNAAFEPAGTTINGVQITASATGIHQISGALVKVG
jgi:type VI secretion system secreted protein VgrG